MPNGRGGDKERPTSPERASFTEYEASTVYQLSATKSNEGVPYNHSKGFDALQSPADQSTSVVSSDHFTPHSAQHLSSSYRSPDDVNGPTQPYPHARSYQIPPWRSLADIEAQPCSVVLSSPGPHPFPKNWISGGKPDTFTKIPSSSARHQLTSQILSRGDLSPLPASELHRQSLSSRASEEDSESRSNYDTPYDGNSFDGGYGGDERSQIRSFDSRLDSPRASEAASEGSASRGGYLEVSCLSSPRESSRSVRDLMLHAQGPSISKTAGAITSGGVCSGVPQGGLRGRAVADPQYIIPKSRRKRKTHNKGGRTQSRPRRKAVDLIKWRSESDTDKEITTDKSHWRIVLGFCEFASFNLQGLALYLTREGLENVFVDSRRTVLQFDGSKYIGQKATYLPPVLTSPRSQRRRTTAGDEVEEAAQQEITVFVFNNGVVLIWGLRPVLEKTLSANRMSVKPLRPNMPDIPEDYGPLKRMMAKFSGPSLKDKATHIWMYYGQIGALPPDFPVPSTRVKNDRLYLKGSSRGEWVAASLAIAQSLRLTVYEKAVDTSVEKVTSLPERMAANEFNKSITQRQDDDGRNLRKHVAELYCRLLDVNVVEDFLDVPEYFWDDDEHQGFWRDVHLYLELEERVRVLNLRYHCLQEIFSVVSSNRVDAQSDRLTRFIIGLLVLNVLALILKAVLEKGQ